LSTLGNEIPEARELRAILCSGKIISFPASKKQILSNNVIVFLIMGREIVVFLV